MSTIPLLVEDDVADPLARRCWLECDLGVTTQRLLLATGSAITRLAPDQDFDGEPRTTAEVPASLHAPFRLAEGVGPGQVRIADVEVSGPLLAWLDDAPGRPGLLGADALAAHKVSLLFSRNELVLDVPAGGGFPLELESPDSTPFVEVRAPGLHTRASFDTGAGRTVVDASFAAAHPEVFTPVGDPRVRDGKLRATTARMPAFRVAGVQFEPTDVAVLDLSETNARRDWPLTLVLGLATIEQADWWFDFPHRAWTVWRPIPQEATA